MLLRCAQTEESQRRVRSGHGLVCTSCIVLQSTRGLRTDFSFALHLIPWTMELGSQFGQQHPLYDPHLCLTYHSYNTLNLGI